MEFKKVFQSAVRLELTKLSNSFGVSLEFLNESDKLFLRREAVRKKIEFDFMSHSEIYTPDTIFFEAGKNAIEADEEFLEFSEQPKVAVDTFLENTKKDREGWKDFFWDESLGENHNAELLEYFFLKGELRKILKQHSYNSSMIPYMNLKAYIENRYTITAIF